MSAASLDTYQGLEKLIYKAVHRFRKRYKGWELAEMISEAQLAYVRACQTHQPEKSKLGTWAFYVIWYSLLDSLRKRCKQREEIALDELHPEIFGKEVGFDLDRFCAELSTDAASVVRLIVDPPGKPRGPHRIRACVALFLLDIGWGARRIAEAFTEISRAWCEGE